MPDADMRDTSDAKRQELSCANVVPVIQYMESVCGIEHTRQAVESVGLPLSFLRLKSNWVSYSYFNKLLDKLVEETGDDLAPYRAPLSIKPQEVFEYALYATQALLWYGGLRLPYRLILGSDLYRRWTKIGRFDILSASSKSIQVSLALDSEFRQTRNNCYAVQGMLASIPVGIGLPAAEVHEVRCAADGAESCVYEVSWQNPRRGLATFAIPAAAVVMVLQATLLGGGIAEILATGFGILLLGVLGRNVHYRRSLREQERVNRERNEYLVKNLEKVEEDYTELLETKTALQERSAYLTIIGRVGEAVGRESTIDSLLHSIHRILLDSLDVEGGDFFLYSSEISAYVSTFGALCEVPPERYRELDEDTTCLRISDLPEHHPLANWAANGGVADLYFLPLNVADVLTGFYCYRSRGFSSLSQELIQSLFEHISGQLRVALARINSRAVIDDILSSIPSFVLIFTSDEFTIRYVNSHFYRSMERFGLPEGEKVINRSLFSLLGFSEDTEDTIRSIVRTLAAEAKSDVFETTVGGVVCEYSVFSIPRSSEGEKYTGIILTDVTEEKSFQAKMLTSEKLLALGRVAGGIAHEINNPLYAVLANAEEIIDDPETGTGSAELAEEITKHVMNISSVVKDLSAYSKTMRKENIDSIDLTEVIRESIKLVAYGSHMMEITSNMDLQPVPRVAAVRGEMQQIFINLLTNAIWAMKRKGTLTIGTRRSGDHIEVSVRDTGIGIPEADLPNIFDYLFTTKDAGEGTGQGLSIVKRLVEQNDGTIGVMSKVGEGTEFTLCFPVYEVDHG